MMQRLADHMAISMTIAFTVYSQLIMRWQVAGAGALPAQTEGRIQFIATLLLQPWVLSAIAASFLAGISWMLAMTRFELSYAFPFMGLNFVLILFASVLLFGESLSTSKILGTILVVAGIALLARN